MTAAEKKALLLERMDEYGRQDICLAFSGGVDSSLLLKLAVDSAASHGTKVYAVTFDSRLHPACDLENARKVAAELGGIHVVVTVDELSMEEIRSNPVDRCYLCKKQLFGKLLEFAGKMNVPVAMEGTNEDDLHVYRPGIRAVRELGVRVLRIEAFAEPLFAVSIVAAGALRGAGDTLGPSVLNLVSMWGVRITLSAALAPRFGLPGVWFAMCFELCVRGLLFLALMPLAAHELLLALSKLQKRQSHKEQTAEPGKV